VKHCRPVQLQVPEQLEFGGAHGGGKATQASWGSTAVRPET
jgi:hypothetical protein